VDDVTFAEFDVTCHRAGCENVDIVIRVNAIAESPNIICGPCGQKIEDVIPVG